MLPLLADVLQNFRLNAVPAVELGVKAATVQQLLQALAKHTNGRPKGSAPDPTISNLIGCTAAFVTVLDCSKLSWLLQVARVKGLKPFLRRWMAEAVEGGDLQGLVDLLGLVYAMLDGGVLSISVEDVEAMRLAELAGLVPMELRAEQEWLASLHRRVVAVAQLTQGCSSVRMARVYGPALARQLQVSCC